MHCGVGLAQLVKPAQDLGRRLQSVHSGVGPGGMCRTTFDANLQVQAAVMRDDDVVAESRADRVIRLAQALRQEPPRSDQTAGFLIVSDMQFNRATQWRSTRLQ